MKIFTSILESANITSATFNRACAEKKIDASELLFTIVDSLDTLPSELERYRQVATRKLVAEQRKLPADAEPYYALIRADKIMSDVIESSNEFQAIQDKITEMKLTALI